MHQNTPGKAVPIEKLSLPPVLYKFRDYSNEYHLAALLEGSLYIPSANEFNDPQDANLPFRYDIDNPSDEILFKKCLEIATQTVSDRAKVHEEAYSLHQRRALEDEHHLEEFDKVTYQRICRDFGIFCLTPEVNNFLMWSYYSNSHQGFCIGYNTKKLVESRIFGMGGLISYQDHFPRIPLFWEKGQSTMFPLLYTKSKIWVHENEYRLIHTLGQGKIKKIDSSFISEVVFGSRFNIQEAQLFKDKIIAMDPNIKISQMTLKKKAFGLENAVIYDPSKFINFGA